MAKRLMIPWHKDLKVPNKSQNCKEVLGSFHSEKKYLLLSGNRASGKTTLGWVYILMMAARRPRTTIVWARSEYSSIIDSSLESLVKHILKYGLQDKRNPFIFKTRPSRLLFKNGSKIILMGLRDIEKIKGVEPLIVVIDEASREKTVETFITIAGSQVGGRAGKWMTSSGQYFNQIIMLTNPSSKGHWIWKLYHDKQSMDDQQDELDEDGQQIQDLLKQDYIEKKDFLWLDFKLNDNPAYSPDGVHINDQGNQALNGLKATHPRGVFYDRYVDGIWCSAEGQVYRIQEENILSLSQITKRWGGLPTNVGWDLRRACDWGADHPSICLWIGLHKLTGDKLVYKEWRKTQADIDEIGLNIKAESKGQLITRTVIDHRKDMQRMLRKHGIPAIFATKGEGSVTEGIILVNAALRRAQEGKPGGLYIYDRAVCNRDPNPVTLTRPRSLIQEMETLEYDPNPKSDKPNKVGDDASDAVRYDYLADNNLDEDIYIEPMLI
ncbi:MAG: phage terminase large subunit [Chloroflexi bacterium]|nr:phage terminase large subunit [Chloroflexota bacterium]